MRTVQIFKGTLVACSPVVQYTKRNGELSVKCAYHLKDGEGRELAVEATGDLTNYVGMVGTELEVTYVNRVFGIDRGGKNWIGNNVYAIAIKMV